MESCEDQILRTSQHIDGTDSIFYGSSHFKITQFFFGSPAFFEQLQDGTLQVLALGEVEKRRGEHWAMVKVGELQEGEMLALPWLERLGRSNRHIKDRLIGGTYQKKVLCEVRFRVLKFPLIR